MIERNIVQQHFKLLHEAAKGINGKLVLASFGENWETGKPIPPKVRHFNIGDVEGMTDAAIQLAEEPWRNVYTSLAVMSSNLQSNKKGKEKDVVAVLGTVADFDHGKGANYIERCKHLSPSFAYETSPDNVQAFFLMDKPFLVNSEEDRRLAKQMAANFTNYISGTDSCSVDLSHVWRIPGLLNHPNNKKVNEGRSIEPFTVREVKSYKDERVSLEQLNKLASVNKLETTQRQQPSQNNQTEYKEIDFKDLSKDLIVQITQGTEQGKRSEAVASVVTKLLHLGYSVNAISACIDKHPLGIGERFDGDANRIADDVVRLAEKFGKEQSLIDFDNIHENLKHIELEPFQPFNVSDIEPRPFVFGSYLIRKKLSFLIAPPGAGKSTFSIAAAISIATGKKILGIPVEEKSKVAIINNEDDMDEMLKRIAGTLKHYDIDQSDIENNIFLHSGEKFRFLIAKFDPEEKDIVEYHKQSLIEYLIKNKISVLIADPFLETHEGNENDNRQMNYVCTLYREIAQKANCAVLVVHHTRKEDGKSSGGHAGNPDSGRGASSLVGAARVVFTLYGMDSKTAKDYGVPDNQKHKYVRMDDAKANLSMLSDDVKWFKKESVQIENGDFVGVLAVENNLQLSAVAQTTNNEKILVGAVLNDPAFEDILNSAEPTGRETFIKAMMDANVYLGTKAKRAALQNRLEDYLLCMADDEEKGIYHYGCRIYMTKQQMFNGRFKVHIERDKPVTTDAISPNTN